MLDGTGRRIQSTIVEDESLHSKLLKVKNDDTKLKTTLMGEYEKDDKLTKFKDDFQRDQYAIKLSEEEKPKEEEKKNDEPAVDPAVQTKTYTKEELDAISKQQVEAALKDYETSDTKKKLDAIMLKEAIAPASSSSSDSGTSGASGGSLAGSVSTSAPKGYDAQREKERAKWLARAKEAEEKAMRQAMLKDLKTGRSAKPPKIAGKSGAGAMSLRDLFQKNQNTGLAQKTDPKRADAGDQMFAFLDRANSTDPKDKYKSYYRMGQGPGDVNPKDLFRTKFDSLYEKARLKALTEGADSEYAGRYVDIFLLVRSIMDDYYKSGKLSETKEIVKPVDIRK
jgi:hypothetical protein